MPSKPDLQATVAALIKEDTGGTCPTCSDPSPMPIFVLLGIGLLLWGSAVVGWAVKKDSSWSASLVAGLVAVVSVFAVWLLVLFALLVIALATLGPTD